ncbi:hypothetical protein MPH_12716 [Macrophomina phaseolina MS6]|uniref:Uncharacterized protein n=1 Tax=Macrophomina phaseolina (strain MS6) TaxID=1126212 RepID=K2QJX6_MACPH|nr:hypothetical protein MPH_12716 [Macrophomina phaseolina MS6]
MQDQALIISALEHYSDSLERIEGIWNFRQTFDDLRTHFLTYMSVFNDMSRDLLRQHLGGYYAELNLGQLMDHQLGTYTEWIAQRLREGLGVRVYQIYEKLVRRLNKKLVLLQEKLGLTADGSVPFLTGDIIDEEQHRHFFEMWWKKPLWASVRARNFRKLVKEIKAEIETIEKVTSSGRSEIVIRQSAKQSRVLYSPCDKYWLAL